MEETTTPQVSFLQHAAKWGSILGGVSIVLTVIAYAADYTILADWKFGIFVLVLLLGATIYAGINYRNEIGGFVSYGKAFQHGFVKGLRLFFVRFTHCLFFCTYRNTCNRIGNALYFLFSQIILPDNFFCNWVIQHQFYRKWCFFVNTNI